MSIASAVVRISDPQPLFYAFWPMVLAAQHPIAESMHAARLLTVSFDEEHRMTTTDNRIEQRLAAESATLPTSTPVLVTEQEVVFSTAAVSVPLATIRHRWLGATVVAAIRRLFLTRPDQPQRHYPSSPSTRSSLEAARMSREMGRL
jgi:hypothetical protein